MKQLLGFACVAGLALAAVRPAAATPMIYQETGRSSLIQLAVIGAGPEWAAQTLLAGDDVKWISPDAEVRSGHYDPAFYNYTRDLFATSLSASAVAMKSTNLLPVSGVPDSDGQAAWLFNTFGPGVRTEAYSTADESTAVNQSASALRVAVWEAMLDSSDDLLSGTFKFNTAGAVRAKTVEYLSALHAGGPWLDIDRPQDPIELPGIPEPASWFLVGTGIAGLVAAGWRGLRRSSRP